METWPILLQYQLLGLGGERACESKRERARERERKRGKGSVRKQKNAHTSKAGAAN